MKIKRITHDNKRRAFNIDTAKGTFRYPYSELDIKPSGTNRITQVCIDKEMANEGFTYTLASGEAGSVHIDHVLSFNEDPSYKAEMLLYNLTIAVQKRIEKQDIALRELARWLDTSAAQVKRLLDQTNYNKSSTRLFELLFMLDADAEVFINDDEILVGAE